MMNWIKLSDEEQQFCETIKKFVEKECAPLEDDIEKTGEIPATLLKKIQELGLYGVTIPQEYGGLGLGILPFCLMLQEISKSHTAIRAHISINNGIGSKGILFFGTEKQKRKYLPALASGRKIAAFCLTEPGAGSDAQNISTTAVRRNGKWILNGMKHFVTNGPIADVFTVIALTDKEKRAKGGITAFIVDRNSKGLKVGKVHEHMGSNAHLQSEIVFEDCEVPEDNLLGNVGEGFRVAMKTLDEGRLTLSSAAIGMAERLLKMGTEYAKIRVQFNKPIAEFQAIQWMLADSATELYAAKTMVYSTAARYDAGEKVSQECAMCKLFSSEMACRVADRVLQIHGGMGYMRETKVERLYRELRAYRIVEGTSEIQRIIISRELLKEQ